MTTNNLELARPYIRSTKDQVLVVGGRSTNFPLWLRSHPQVLLWESTNAATLRKRSLPGAVKVVLQTRFVRHQIQQQIESWNRKDTLLIKQTLDLREIKMILATLFGVQVDTKRQLADFVREHADYSASPQVKEIQRLKALAQANGIPTATAGGVAKLFRDGYNRRYAEPTDLRPTPSRPAPLPPPPPLEIDVRQEEEAPKPVPSSAVAQLKSAQDALENTALYIAELLEENAHLKEENQKAQARLEKLDQLLAVLKP